MGDADRYATDFAVEGDIHELLVSLVTTYAFYEVRLATISSFAAENIMRQNATSESLKKIDEIEQETRRVARKVKLQKSFRKVLSDYVNKISFGGQEK